MALYSRNFITMEINYEIYDKELFAMVDSFQKWHHLLEGTIMSYDGIYRSPKFGIFYASLDFELLLNSLKYIIIWF